MTNQPAPEKCFPTCGSPSKRGTNRPIDAPSLVCADPWHGVLPVEPQPVQVNGREVRRGFGEFELSDLKPNEFVTASGLRDGGYIVWEKLEPAVETVPVVTPQPIKALDQINEELNALPWEPPLEPLPQVDRHIVWLVESLINGKSDGFWTGVPKGIGGWITDDPHAAKRYTEAEAKVVAATLDYFPSPFSYSHWIATEHVFIGTEPDLSKPGINSDHSSESPSSDVFYGIKRSGVVPQGAEPVTPKQFLADNPPKFGPLTGQDIEYIAEVCEAYHAAASQAETATGAQGGEDAHDYADTADLRRASSHQNFSGASSVGASSMSAEQWRVAHGISCGSWCDGDVEAYAAELKAKIAELEQELLTAKNMILILQREGLRDLDDLRKAERERDQAREALRAIGNEIGAPTTQYAPNIERKELLRRGEKIARIVSEALGINAAVSPSEDAPATPSEPYCRNCNDGALLLIGYSCVVCGRSNRGVAEPAAQPAGKQPPKE